MAWGAGSSLRRNRGVSCGCRSESLDVVRPLRGAAPMASLVEARFSDVPTFLLGLISVGSGSLGALFSVNSLAP